MTSNSEKTSDRNEEDNLQLTDINIPEIPKDIIFPNELNEYLRDRIQYLLYEKGRLQKNLSDSETELARSKSEVLVLNSKLEQYEKMCLPSSSNLANATNAYNYKIVELSKQLREKSSEMEKYKTKCSKLEQTILELRKSQENEIDEGNKKTITEVPSNEIEDQVKSLQDRLNSTKAKLCEMRNSNLQLKNELKVANKFLLQEVGDNLESLQKTNASTNSNWRGRAQIICDLQQKNNELKEKLKMYQDKEQGIVHVKEDSNKKDSKRLEMLTQENKDLKENLDEIKKKLEAVRARNKVYESETIMLKAKQAATNEQNEMNCKLIAQLTSQLSEFHDKQNDLVNEKQKVVDNLEKENKHLELLLSKERCLVENLQKEVDSKTQSVNELKDQIEKGSFSYYDSTNSDIRKLEGERIRLVELTEMLSRRLEAEKESHFKTESSYLFERQKAAKLESKLARVTAEMRTKSTKGYVSGSGASYTYGHVLKAFSPSEELENRLELAEETIKSLETKLQLEKEEREADVEQFTKILKARLFNSDVDWDR